MLTWGVDRITKIQALSLQGIKSFGFLELSLHYNPGAILGLFSQLPAVLRVVTLSTGGAFLIFSYLILQYIIPIRALTLRIGMSLLLGGIIGNVADRIVWGHVVDFISFRFGSWSSPIFNLADAIQWVGHGLVMFSLLTHADLFWPESNTRKSQWVNFKFQLKYCLILMTVGIGMGVVAWTLSYTYLRVTLLTVTGDNHTLLKQYLVPFSLSFLAVSGIFIWTLFLIGKIISLRVAGPVFAFERYIDDLLKGKFREFRVRRSDEFQHFNEIADKLKEHLSKTIPPSDEHTLNPTLNYDEENSTTHENEIQSQSNSTQLIGEIIDETINKTLNTNPSDPKSTQDKKTSA
jgi:signal peptidase II